MSETITQTSGIAQGTFLGPLSFSLYINDLPSCLKCSICKLFADDAKLYFIYGPLASTDEFQNDLYALVHWFNMWQLTIAVSKTFMMYFGFHNKHRIYKLNGMDIVEQNDVRDLGVYIASDF